MFTLVVCGGLGVAAAQQDWSDQADPRTGVVVIPVVPVEPAEYWEIVAERYSEASERAEEAGNEPLSEMYERSREAAEAQADRHEPWWVPF